MNLSLNGFKTINNNRNHSNGRVLIASCKVSYRISILVILIRVVGTVLIADVIKYELWDIVWHVCKIVGGPIKAQKSASVLATERKEY